MVHIYYGNGKGKTTAAAGLAIRAASRGYQVLFVQFLKDGTSGEIACLRKMDGVDVLTQKGSYPFFSSMTEEQKEAAAKEYSDLADKGLLFLKEEGKAKRLLVLDEVLHAIRYHLLPEEQLLELLSYSNETREIVLTGYNPSERILAAADYITEMQKVRHPYDVGITSREGIEW